MSPSAAAPRRSLDCSKDRTAARGGRARRLRRSRLKTVVWPAKRRQSPASCSRTMGFCRLRPAAAVAVVGPLADSRANMQGTWAVAARPADSVSVVQGLRDAIGDAGRIVYAQGANIVDDPNVAARLNVFGETFAIDPRTPARADRRSLECRCHRRRGRGLRRRGQRAFRRIRYAHRTRSSWQPDAVVASVGSSRQAAGYRRR